MKFRIDKTRGGWIVYQITAGGTQTRIGKYKTMRAAEVAIAIRSRT